MRVESTAERVLPVSPVYIGSWMNSDRRDLTPNPACSRPPQARFACLRIPRRFAPRRRLKASVRCQSHRPEN